MIRTSASNDDSISVMIMVRTFASSLLRWLTAAAYGSRRVHFRRDGTEFLMASQSACNGSRAAGCASIDALRPHKNWVNFKDNYEISFIRETFAAFARRFPTEGRSPASSRRACASSQENILAAIGCVFRRKRRRQDTATTPNAAGAQWCAASATGAQA